MSNSDPFDHGRGFAVPWESPFDILSLDVGPDTSSPHEAPQVTICAGLHGDEVNGVTVALILGGFLREHRHLVLKKVRLIPLVNVLAFEVNRRSWPLEGPDIYDCFTRADSNGSLSQRVAHSVMESVSESRYVIDIHSSNRHVREFPHVRIYLAPDSHPDAMNHRKAHVELARHFHMGPVWTKTFYEASAYGRESVGPIACTLSHRILSDAASGLYESWPFIVMLGSSESLNKKDCACAVIAALRFMVGVGVIEPSVMGSAFEWTAHQLCLQSEDVRLHDARATALARSLGVIPTAAIAMCPSPTSGILICSHGVGDYLAKGSSLGSVLEPNTLRARPIPPVKDDCVILSLKTSPLVYKDSLVARLARTPPRVLSQK